MNLIPINNSGLNQISNANLIPQFSLFNEAHTWNILSGSGSATNLTNRPEFFNTGALRISPTPNIVVNTGANQMQVTVPNDGDYIFSLSHRFSVAVENDQTFKIKVYVNGTLLDDFTTVANTVGETNFEKPYQRYFINLLGLSQNDTVDFAFSFDAPSYGGNFKHYFAGLKFESDVMQNGLPSVFNLPLVEDLETTQTIDIPNIVTKTTHRVDITLIGAEVGDFVQITYPITILTDGLIVSVPIVTATNTVSFLIYNNSLSDVDSLSGDYSIKITK